MAYDTLYAYVASTALLAGEFLALIAFIFINSILEPENVFICPYWLFVFDLIVVGFLYLFWLVAAGMAYRYDYGHMGGYYGKDSWRVVCNYVLIHMFAHAFLWALLAGWLSAFSTGGVSTWVDVPHPANPVLQPKGFVDYKSMLDPFIWLWPLVGGATVILAGGLKYGYYSENHPHMGGAKAS